MDVGQPRCFEGSECIFAIHQHDAFDRFIAE
jgi:hypothetical protein